jgi:hypothetical protein
MVQGTDNPVLTSSGSVPYRHEIYTELNKQQLEFHNALRNSTHKTEKDSSSFSNSTGWRGSSEKYNKRLNSCLRSSGKLIQVTKLTIISCN